MLLSNVNRILISTLLLFSGFQGVFCSEIFDVCKYVSPCGSHGTCSNTVIGSELDETDQSYFSCACDIGWAGRRCDEDVNECELFEPCANGGSCTNTEGSYSCSCNRNWAGKTRQHFTLERFRGRGVLHHYVLSNSRAWVHGIRLWCWWVIAQAYIYVG